MLKLTRAIVPRISIYRLQITQQICCQQQIKSLSQSSIKFKSYREVQNLKNRRKLSLDELSEEEKTKFLRLKATIAFVIIAILVRIVGYYIPSHKEECPHTGRKRIMKILSSLNNPVHESVTKIVLKILNHNTEIPENKLPETNHYHEKVKNVAMKILNSNKDIPEIIEKNWTFSVIDDNSEEQKRLFVLSNGDICVFTGILKEFENDDQLGIALAHEIAHVCLDHSTELVSQFIYLSLTMLIPLTAIWAFVSFKGFKVPFLTLATLFPIFVISNNHYSRICETEADEFGLKLASKACLDIRQAPLLMDKFEKSVNRENKQWRLPEIFCSHPYFETRKEHFVNLLPENLDLRLSCGCDQLPECDKTTEDLKQIALGS